MNEDQPRNPLHGVKLEQVLTDLVDTFGWPVLAEEVSINCFRSNPSVKSSLKFLRKTQWARDKVEALYIDAIVKGKPLRSQRVAKPSPKLSDQKSAPNKMANSHIWKVPS